MTKASTELYTPDSYINMTLKAIKSKITNKNTSHFANNGT